MSGVVLALQGRFRGGVVRERLGGVVLRLLGWLVVGLEVFCFDD